MTHPRYVTFHGGRTGPWRILRIATLCGAPIEPAERIDIIEGRSVAAQGRLWSLVGTTSHLRYTTGDEAGHLAARKAELGRPGADRAALIPIRKSSAWWALAQDERRAIFEEQSRHIAIGLDYLPAIARRLYHSRDLAEPFDFLTWFEFAAAAEPAFDEMLERLRAGPEWDYVDREIDIRLTREA